MNTPAMLWTGRILTGLFALFMLGASVAPKLLGLPVAEETMAQLGWPPGYAFMIGLIELACVVLYLIPRTSVLGAVLMMGLLGGAMATQIRWATRCSATFCSASISGCSCGAGYGYATRAFGRCFLLRWDFPAHPIQAGRQHCEPERADPVTSKAGMACSTSYLFSLTFSSGVPNERPDPHHL